MTIISLTEPKAQESPSLINPSEQLQGNKKTGHGVCEKDTRESENVEPDAKGKDNTVVTGNVKYSDQSEKSDDK